MTFTRQEFRSLFMDQRDRIYRLLLRLTRSAQDAEDLLQETFLTVWRKRDQFEGRGAPEGYVRKTAVRLYLNAMQQRGRRPATHGADEALARVPAAGDEEGSERREAVAYLVTRVEEALDTLPEPLREAFVLFRFEGFTCAEIAELTDTPKKTVETRLRRATLALAERLKPYQHLMPAS